MLEKFARQPCRLGDFEGEYYATQHWNETLAQQDGTICRETRFPARPQEWVLSGPHFYVGNPMYKTPRAVCTEKGHYDVLDLTDLPDDYLSRTNYVPACSPEEYARRTPRVPWKEAGESEGRLVTEFYRVNASRGLSQSGERTLQGSILPPLAAHIDGVFSVALRDRSSIPFIAGLWMSLPMDFFVKSTGKGDLRNDLAKRMALPELKVARPALLVRGLILTCLGTYMPTCGARAG